MIDTHCRFAEEEYTAVTIGKIHSGIEVACTTEGIVVVDICCRHKGFVQLGGHSCHPNAQIAVMVLYMTTI